MHFVNFGLLLSETIVAFVLFLYDTSELYTKGIS
jgi:hypothetical protein